MRVKVANETFLAIALLHRENPGRADFTISEIVDRAERERLHPGLRRGVRVHASSGCVANRPHSGNYRMLYATGKNTRRLFRSGDNAHPLRSGKIWPERDEIPGSHHEFLDWVKEEYYPHRTGGEDSRWLAGVMAMKGMGGGRRRDEDHRRVCA